MYIEKLSELNICELECIEDKWKYVITTYDDETEIQYWETREKEMELIEKFSVSSCCDIQLFKKVIEMRETYNQSK